MSSSKFRQGVRALKDYGLVLDVWAYHTQLAEVLDLALANPEVVIVLDHVGGHWAFASTLTTEGWFSTSGGQV
ncbi:hypothetical protein KI429_07320 [Pseudomonas shirazica]|nr:hypothetical protein KI429_07320 [Pseudomonas shirazica]